MSRTTSANPKTVEAVLSSSISEKARIHGECEGATLPHGEQMGNVSKLANALAVSQHYDKQILEYVKLTSALQVHQGRLEQLHAFTAEMAEHMATEEEVDALLQACRDASFLQTELPTGAVEQDMEKLFAKLVKSLEVYLAAEPESKRKVMHAKGSGSGEHHLPFQKGIGGVQDCAGGRSIQECGVREAGPGA